MNGKPNFRPRPAGMDRERAETMAVEALGFLGRSPERLARFLEVTGLRPDGLRTAARTPGFLAGLMDYVAGEEELLLAFAEDAGVRPESVMQARHLLSPTEFPD